MNKMAMKRLITFGIILVMVARSYPEALPPPIEIRVGVADANQFPFVFKNGAGISSDLFTLLNASQSNYHFSHTSLPVLRLHQEFQKGNFDIISFSNINWSWRDDAPAQASLDLTESGEVYIALKKAGRDRSFFDQKNLQLIGVRGFHYKITYHETNKEILKERYNMHLVETEMDAIRMILNHRGDVTIATQSCLNYLRKTDPTAYNQLLISKKYDSQYNRHCVIRDSAPISTQSFNTLLEQLKASGALAKLYSRYGMTLPQKAPK